jgi:nucleoside-diphosphate-sugar epimerase
MAKKRDEIMNQLYYRHIDEYLDRINLEIFDNKTILITGGTGLILSYFVDFLIASKELNFILYLYVRDISQSKLRFHDKKNRIIFKEYAFSNKIDIEVEVDYIIHGASYSDPLSFAKYPVDTMMVNFVGLSNVLEFAKLKKNAKVLYLSSGEIYGKLDAKVVTEKTYGIIDPLDVRSCYNLGKKASETLCISYMKQYNINVNIARISRVYGPTMKVNDSKALSSFLRNALDKQDIILKSEGRQIFSFTYVFDVITALNVILRNGVSGEAYNIAADFEQLTLVDIARYISELAGVNVVFSLPNDIEKSGYSRISKSVLDNQKLKEIGWRPIFGVKEGLSCTYLILDKNNNETNNGK